MAGAAAGVLVGGTLAGGGKKPVLTLYMNIFSLFFQTDAFLLLDVALPKVFFTGRGRLWRQK